MQKANDYIRQSRVLTLLRPELESVEGDIVEATVDDEICEQPVTVMRHSRAVVAFVDGESIFGRFFGVREHLRFFQPASLCLQVALGEHPCAVKKKENFNKTKVSQKTSRQSDF